MSEDEKQERVRQMLAPYEKDSLTAEEVMTVLNIKRRRVDSLRNKRVLRAYPLDPNAKHKDWRYPKVEIALYLLNNIH